MRKKKNIAKRPTFDFARYTLSFSFCNKHERYILYRCLKEAWEWAYPPVKPVESADDSKENTDK